MKSINKTREAAVAGMFYSKNKETLARELAMYLETAPPEKNVQNIIGIAVPHAGYMYSGGVAARAYRQIVDREYDTVVVISPSHRIYFEEISVYNGRAYSTPLGEAAVDLDTVSELAACDDKIIVSALGHDIDEHALEVQLPFLQHVLGDFKLVPIVMGNQDGENVEILANALGRVLKDKKALIVASSDLSHFHPYDQAVSIDRGVVDYINQFDEDLLFRKTQNGDCEMCGSGPVVATMKAARMLGADKSRVLLYRNSGDVSGDRSRVVGYLAAIFYR